MAEMTEEEVQKLREAAARAEQLARESEEAKAKHAAELQQIQQAHQAQIQQVGEWVRNFAAQQQGAQAPVEDAEATVEDLPLSKLKQMISEGAMTGVSPILQQHYRNQADLNLRSARRDMPDFSRFEQEVKAMLAQQPLEVQANPTAWEAAYKAARAAHMEEIVEEQLQARIAAQQAAAAEVEEEVEEETEPEAPRPAAPRAAPPIAVASATGATGAAQRRKPKAPLLDEREARMASRFDMEATDFAKYADPNYSPDVFGFNDPQTGKPRRKV